MRDNPVRTQLHSARALHRGNQYNSDNTDKMGGPKLRTLVDELCLNFVPALFFRKLLGQ